MAAYLLKYVSELEDAYEGLRCKTEKGLNNKGDFAELAKLQRSMRQWMSALSLLSLW